MSDSRAGDALGMARTAGWVFAATLACYLFFYLGDRYLRTRHGAWEVAFGVGAEGREFLVVDQPSLGIRGVRVELAEGGVKGAGGGEERVVFDRPRVGLRSAEWVFDDLSYLPGIVVFNWRGHGVQLTSRVLSVDGHRRPWSELGSGPWRLTATHGVAYPPHKQGR